MSLIFWGMMICATGFVVLAIGYAAEMRRAAREAYRGAIRREFD